MTTKEKMDARIELIRLRREAAQLRREAALLIHNADGMELRAAHIQAELEESK